MCVDMTAVIHDGNKEGSHKAISQGQKDLKSVAAVSLSQTSLEIFVTRKRSRSVPSRIYARPNMISMAVR